MTRRSAALHGPGGARHESGVERRAAPRAHIEVEVSLTSESHFFVGLTGDLSGGGLFVATWSAVPVGAPVALAVSLPDGPVLARGHVRWVRDAAEGRAPGLGVAFESLSDEDRARVEAFCTERAPWYYEVDD
jgi:type IV pilus assembly protein PilZ